VTNQQELILGAGGAVRRVGGGRRSVSEEVV
jgi:hypothetical protein